MDQGSENYHQQGQGSGDYIPPRRTPMACAFCRARKLKCDGRQTCGNCARRAIPCIYVPVSSQGTTVNPG
ncbi:hypothetical protein QCA50_011320 [Cerrena zonata]|uniref:Zn(2)-C6 fungal-type domain-containing protein n=1 Tax=Cerrena zonata TaxID=2478898 RepID=A0AAW0G1T4_9APHY